MDYNILFFVLGVIAMTLILMQSRGAGLSSTFGGGNQVYLTKRGIEKWVVTGTFVTIALMIIVRVISLY
jgi:protein translocase SecG subunit